MILDAAPFYRHSSKADRRSRAALCFRPVLFRPVATRLSLGRQRTPRRRRRRARRNWPPRYRPGDSRPADGARYWQLAEPAGVDDVDHDQRAAIVEGEQAELRGWAGTTRPLW